MKTRVVVDPIRIQSAQNNINLPSHCRLRHQRITPKPIYFKGYIVCLQHIMRIQSRATKELCGVAASMDTAEVIGVQIAGMIVDKKGEATRGQSGNYFPLLCLYQGTCRAIDSVA